jgi:hypothetical protein
MSEPAAKRPMIDLDEFERRLRRPTPAAVHTQEDPLAELARLVGGVQEDPFKNVFEQDRHLPRSPRMAAAQGGAARVVQAPPRVQAAPRVVQEDFGAEDYAASDQHLHGTIHPQDYADQSYVEPVYAETYAHDEQAMMAAHAGYNAASAEAQDYAWSEAGVPVGAAAPMRSAIADAPRSRRPLYVMAVIIAAGIAGIGVSFAYKSKSGPHELAMIKAMSGPTKVQPDSPGGADVANQDASILDKTPQPTPVALVDHQERPVDLGRQPAAQRTIMADAAGSMGAASVPVPPPPTAQAAAPQNIQSYGIGALIEPKKVKTVSVRSDGTLLPNDTPPQMPQSAPAAAPAMQAQHPAAPATSGATTPKPATTKSTARVVTTPKPQSIEQQVADDNGEAAAAPAAATPVAPVKPKPVSAKPMKVAETETTDSIPDSADKHASGGSFAVQLAAPGSEQEAHDMTSKLASKFGSELKGHHLTYHRAKVNDKTVFRVRAAGMSHEEATGICQKLQASGGSCFVAKD